MKISQNGINLVKRFEGCRLMAYKCPAGVWTIGYGHTGSDVWQGLTITQAKAEQLLRQDMMKFETHVMKFNNRYHWNQNEFDALVSFAFNVGSINQLTQNGKRSRVQIAAAMLKYNRGGGKILPGLTKRRQAEQELFLRPVAVSKEEKEDNEMIENSKVIVNGKEVPVRRILKDGTNFIAVRDVGKIFNCEVSAKGNIPVLKSK